MISVKFEFSAKLAGIMDLVATAKEGNSINYPSKFLTRVSCCSHDVQETCGHLTNGTTPTFTCKFHTDALNGHLLAYADEQGSLVLRDLRRPLSDPASWLVGIAVHDNAVFDLEWLPHENKLITASGDRSLRLWDMSTYKPLATFLSHEGSVKSVSIGITSSSVIASGGRDGVINLWDLRYKAKSCGHHQPIKSIPSAHCGEVSSGKVVRKRKRNGRPAPPNTSGTGTVTAVKFVGEHLLASSGASDECVKVWDIRKLGSFASEPFTTFRTGGSTVKKFGFTSLTRDSYCSRLYATGTDSLVYCFDTACFNEHPTQVFGGYECSSFYIKSAISPDNRFLLSGSSCGNAFIWDTKRCYERPFVLIGHQSEVTCVAWSPAHLDLLTTCSDDHDIMTWRAGRPPVGHNADSHCSTIGVKGECKVFEGNGHMKAVEKMSSVVRSNPIHQTRVRDLVKSEEKENVSFCKQEGNQLEMTPTSDKQTRMSQRSLKCFFS